MRLAIFLLQNLFLLFFTEILLFYLCKFWIFLKIAFNFNFSGYLVTHAFTGFKLCMFLLIVVILTTVLQQGVGPT